MMSCSGQISLQDPCSNRSIVGQEVRQTIGLLHMQTQTSNQTNNSITSGRPAIQIHDSTLNSVNHVSIPVHSSQQERSQHSATDQIDIQVSETETPQFITVTVYGKDAETATKTDHSVLIAIKNDMCAHQMEASSNSKLSEQGSQEQETISFQSNESVHSTYIQYVDGSNDPALYTASNGQMTNYPSYTVIGSTTTTPYYSTSGTSFTYTQVENQESTVEVQNPIISNQGDNNYNISGNALDGDNRFSSCASPATGEQFVRTPDPKYEVQWLIDNFETAEGVSLPRSTLYSHYLRHCSENKLDPINAASFGKLIRSVFLGLRTRRLGTRGNSKYHYYGIRVKSTSSLNQLSDVGSVALRQQPSSQIRRYKQHSVKSEICDKNDNSTDSRTQSFQQYLGDASTAIPAFSETDFGDFIQRSRLKEEDVQTFVALYKEHYEDILDAIVNLQFSRIESIWQTFWQMDDNYKQNDSGLDKSKLYAICIEEPVLCFIRQVDYKFYQNLVDVLIPNVLRPIPGTLTQSIRNFAKNVEGWLTTALSECPEEIVKIKIGAVCAFSQTLRRYTSLNHLAQAARAVLQNPAQIHQMMTDLNRVDFHNVQEQASWVCQCDDDLVQWIQQDFKTTLQQQNSLEQWAGWLENVVNVVLQPHEGKADFAKAARQFLLKWSFYSSMVIRDLTLRSAASFGSFHLIRLLYDEYMFYLIEHRVAKVIGETPMAVMGELIGLTLVTCHKSSKMIARQKCTNSTNELSTVKGVCKDKQPSASVYGSNGMKEAYNQSILASLLGHSQNVTNKNVEVG